MNDVATSVGFTSDISSAITKVSLSLLAKPSITIELVPSKKDNSPIETSSADVVNAVPT